MFVLGTAGHIDHGKSSLVKALTGTDPDRLPEEKDRGMTIDLGFAHLTLPGGEEIGIIDVPGHERFVRNMVAGAGGINAAMLVVAADDGWMPQTTEHFAILNLLDIKFGLVALTKIDMVEPDWVELISADIRSKLQGSFLADAPIIPVSSITSEGLPDLIAALSSLSGLIRQADDIGKARLFIDRAFVLTGVGVVVTGTSRGGGFNGETEVHHFPSGEKVRIRTLQSHDRRVDTVGPGARVAMNLGGVERATISRGDVITNRPYLSPPNIFAVHLKNLADSKIVLSEGRRLLMILGTTETEASLRPFNNEGIKPGEEGFAFLRTDYPVAAFLMDHFILRLPTPQVTIGGGVVLDIVDIMLRRKELPDHLAYLVRRRSGELTSLLMTEIDKKLFVPAENLLYMSNFSEEAISTTVEALVQKGELTAFEGQLALTANLDRPAAAIRKELEKTHKHRSYLKGLTAEELARSIRLPPDDHFSRLLRYLEKGSDLSRAHQFYHLPGFTASLDDALRKQAAEVIRAVEQAGHNFLTPEEVEARFPNCRRTLQFLKDDGKLKFVADQYIMPAEMRVEILTFLEEKLDSDGRLSVAEFRDRFGSSRKYALGILEYLDRINVTRRDGDFRVKGTRYDERHTI